ncbi:MAG: VCBS repeat-containing protein [Gemmatimonadaceae bacterium]
MIKLSLIAGIVALSAIALTGRTIAPPPRFAAHEIATGLRGGYQVVVADVNHDGKPDLIVVASGLPELLWFENPTWTRHVLARGMTSLINVAAADIDGDGFPEITVASGFSANPSESSGSVGGRAVFGSIP